MASDRAGSRRRTRLSKAEIKAYEARRAAERQRLAMHESAETEEVIIDEPIMHTYLMTRDDEYGVIKYDLIRLGWIVAALVVLLAIATVLLS